MKKMLKGFIPIAALAVGLPSWAGPDFRMIEQAREAKRASMRAAAEDKERPYAEGESREKAEGAVVLPLDHGPRTDVTPFANEKRRAMMQSERESNGR